MKPTNNIGKLAVLALLGAGTAGTASAQAFEQGTTAINLGIGLGGTQYSYLSGIDNDYSVSPMFLLSLEHGIANIDNIGAIGVGLLAGRKTVSLKYSYGDNAYEYDYNQKWSNTVIGVRGALHFGELIQVEKLDVYGGLMIGYNIGSYKDKSTQTRKSDGRVTDIGDNYHYKLSFVTWGLYAGGRYFFSEHFGGYAEVGYGASYFNLGLTAKF